jgi:hypothetical protein
MAYPLEPLSLEQERQFDERDEHRVMSATMVSRKKPRLVKRVHRVVLEVLSVLQLVGRQVFVVGHTNLALAGR